MQRTIREDLPREADFLVRFDRWKARVQSLVDMPEATLDLLYRFLAQNQGALSKRALKSEFAALEAEEVSAIEEAFAEELSAITTGTIER